jgi:hypothetical protein
VTVAPKAYLSTYFKPSFWDCGDYLLGLCRFLVKGVNITLVFFLVFSFYTSFPLSFSLVYSFFLLIFTSPSLSSCLLVSLALSLGSLASVAPTTTYPQILPSTSHQDCRVFGMCGVLEDKPMSHIRNYCHKLRPNGCLEAQIPRHSLLLLGNILL